MTPAARAVRRLGHLLCVLLPLAMGACRGRTGPATSAPVPIRFVEVSEQVGLHFAHRTLDGELDLLSESMGSGVAWLDSDNDGDWDIYAVNGPDRPSALYRNDGGMFTDVGEHAGVAHPGWGMGVAAADYDGDGWVDLYVTNFNQPNRLYRNLGDGTFKDVTAKAGVGGPPGLFSMSAAWGDVDGDGDLDLYVVRYVDFTNPLSAVLAHPTERDELITLVPDPYLPQPNVLYRNNGDGTFTDITGPAGVANGDGKGLGAVFGDYDNDGDLDLYVANDNTRNVLYKNRGNGTFDDVSFAAGVDDARGCMGVDFGDYDEDGDLDLFWTNWNSETNALARNNAVRADGRRPSDSFDDITLDAGLGAPSLGMTGWGTHFADFDRDGDLDLYVANGFTSPGDDDKTRCIGQRSQLFRNDNGTFVEVPEAFAFTAWGAGRGSGVADYDDDGDLDILLTQNNGRLLLFRNDTPAPNGWVKVRAPAGARVELRIGRRTHIREVAAGSSYLSSSAPELVVGVAGGKSADRIRVRLPDGTTHMVRRAAVGSRVVFSRARPPQVVVLNAGR
jgi:hypothetical protein